MEDLMKFIMAVCDQNPGAITFVTQALSRAQSMGEDELERCVVALQRAKVLGITGVKLYAIWNDHHKRDCDATLKCLVSMSESALNELAKGL